MVCCKICTLTCDVSSLQLVVSAASASAEPFTGTDAMGILTFSVETFWVYPVVFPHFCAVPHIILYFHGSPLLIIEEVSIADRVGDIKVLDVENHVGIIKLFHDGTAPPLFYTDLMHPAQTNAGDLDKHWAILHIWLNCPTIHAYWKQVQELMKKNNHILSGIYTCIVFTPSP